MSTKKIQSQTKSQLSSGKIQSRFKRIVIIDENDVDLFINESLLKELSLSQDVKRENDPTKILNQLKNATRLSDVPELIFLDLKIESDGNFSFLNEFKQLSDFVRNTCKIVVITSAELNEDKFRILMNPNVIRLLIKPIDIYQIKDIIYS